MTFWRPYIHALGAVLLLASIAVWNGYPLLYEDTEAYVGRPAAALASTGRPWLASEWASSEPASPADAPRVASSQAATESTDDGWLAGRSVYWGTLAYLLILGFGVWGVVVLNALCLSVVLALFWFRALRRTSAPRFYLIVAVVAAASYASLFVALLTPDIFAAVLIIGMALLIVAWNDLRVADRLVLLLLCILATVSHDSIVLIAAGMAILACLNRGIAGAAGWLSSWGQTMAISLPAVAGVFSLLLFNWVAITQTGQAALRLPFLSAHFSSMESGKRHLDEVCPEAKYALCSYQDRLPLPWTDFIFSPSQETGIFAPAPQEIKRQLSEEQYRFAANVAVDQPALLTFELVRATFIQLSTFDLDDIHQSSKEEFFERNFPAAVLAQARKTQLWSGSKAFELFQAVQLITAVLSIIAVAALAFLRARGVLFSPKHSWSIALLIFAGILANAAVCGILASPWGRFQARVVWLITLVGIAMVATARASVKPSDDSSFSNRRDVHAVASS